jgi:hypothetical protein
VAALAAATLALVGCGDDSEPSGTFELPSSVASGYRTAYIAEVVADPPGDDLAEGGGEHLVIRNNADIRIDMGGWWIDVGSDRLPLGIGRQIDVAAELRVHPGPGNNSDEAVFVGLGHEVLVDDGGVAVLRDSAGSEVATFEYGSRRP